MLRRLGNWAREAPWLEYLAYGTMLVALVLVGVGLYPAAVPVALVGVGLAIMAGPW